MTNFISNFKLGMRAFKYLSILQGFVRELYVCLLHDCFMFIYRLNELKENSRLTDLFKFN